MLAGTLVVTARSLHSDAYHALIPLWAGLTLSVAVVHRVRATWLVLVLAAGILVAHVGRRPWMEVTDLPEGTAEEIRAAPPVRS